MKRKFTQLLCFGMLMLPMSIHAEEAVKYLFLKQKNGTEVVFPLADNPVIKVNGNTLEITSKAKTVTTTMAEIAGYSLKETTTTDIQQNANATPQQQKPQFVSGHALFSGLKEGTPIQVVSIDGKQVYQQKADANGCADIDLTPYAKGIYILKTPTISIKILNNN